MAEKLDECPDCRRPLRDAGYDLQHCPCGWDRDEWLKGDVYQGTVARLEANIVMVDRDAALASLAISTKRAADALERIAGWLDGNGPAFFAEQISNAIQSGLLGMKR